MKIPHPKANRGVPLEKQLLATAVLYWDRGIAWYDKVEVPKAFDARNKKMFYKKRTGFDFYGCTFPMKAAGVLGGVPTAKVGMIPNGLPRPLFFEVKSVNEPRLRLVPEGAKGSGIQFHQLTWLCNLEQKGCVCYVLWLTDDRLYRMSPLAVREKVGAGHSITLSKHADLLTEVPFKMGVWDFLLAM